MHAGLLCVGVNAMNTCGVAVCVGQCNECMWGYCVGGQCNECMQGYCVWGSMQ